MSDLSDDERAAITHWAHYGQVGEPVTERFIPDDDERARLAGFIRPQSGVWPDRFDIDQTRALVNGFPRRDMEDKWVIYSDDLRADGTTTVHFHRSWTGLQVLSVDLLVDETGSSSIAARWEMDPDALNNPSEEFARTSFSEVCRWVLGMRPAT